MFESAELGHKISKTTFDAAVPELREALLNAQFDLAQQAKFPVIILIGGLDGAGRSETVNLLNEWMDPRFLQTHGMGEPSDEEMERPMMWRFWRALPPKGRIGLFLGSWYTWPILHRVKGHTNEAELVQSLERARRFEKMLTDEGALVLKFWLHLSREKQLARLKLLEKSPLTRWRVTQRDWEHYKQYDKFLTVNESVIRHTSTAEAPWLIIEGEDHRYRSLTIGQSVLQSLRKRLDESTNPVTPEQVTAAPLLPAIDKRDLLHALDQTRRLGKAEYRKLLEKYQGKLALLSRDPRFQKLTVVVAFEGNDAAGKGGAIRRITGALDARRYQIIPVAAPTEEERAQPYLWRFWRHIPRRGRIAIFDRSWYGRVLVERIENFCNASDWMRAYGEINDFEGQLVRNRILVVKFWLAISKEEQLKRFKEREKIGFKRFKITDEDWRNRDKWEAYEHAVCDMVDHTSTETAPWTLVEANDKNFARIKILKTLCKQIERAMKAQA
ncbi:MAG: polyphosphate:AMP phosphotransferase [Gallionella sp.]|jgi:polyphosphate:AMP phosphotransferase|nr:polyphosphate:AMP phosphotransferase [Gallionella sp.]